MPIYFLLSIWVLLSVGSEPTPQAYFERGALFYNALTAGKDAPREMANTRGKRLSPDGRGLSHYARNGCPDAVGDNFLRLSVEGRTFG